MKNVLTILRRDLGTYFTSPIGYIFMIVFALLSVGLFMTPFFTFPQADMRPFFETLPVLLCIFIPAVTMRVWAEERKENTWEMLLTFPMKAWELVVGKFMACFVFFALTLAGTFTIPLMLARLGNPDFGAIFGGYFGTLLMGAFFLSFGVLISGFFKDQIIAFVVTLLGCTAIFALGTDFVSTYLDSACSGLGTLLSTIIGVTGHYDTFTRGVIELTDLLYFLVWTGLLLFLNTIYIEGRSRPNVRAIFSLATALSIGIGLGFNWLLIGESLMRVDTTQDKIYTISESSKKLLAELQHPVKAYIYISSKDKMPTGMKDIEQNITDKLEELRIAAKGKFDYSTVYLDVNKVLAENTTVDESTEEKAIEKRIFDKGVQPFTVQAMSQDEMTNKFVYSSVGIVYGDKKEEIIPRIMPDKIGELEFRVISTIQKMKRDKMPVVALVAPKDALEIDPGYRRMMKRYNQKLPDSEDPFIRLEQLLQFEKYEVKRVELTTSSPMPDEYDVLVIVWPTGWDERQAWEINRAIASGKPTVMFVQNVEWSYTPSRNGVTPNLRNWSPGVNDLLSNYGLRINEDILMDASHTELGMAPSQQAMQSGAGGSLPVKWPIHILLKSNSMSPDNPITSRLSSIFYLWGSSLIFSDDVIDQLQLKKTVLMSTSERAWTVPFTGDITATFFDEPEQTQQFPLMAMLEGQFPDIYKDKPRPALPPEPVAEVEKPRPVKPEGPEKPLVLAPGKLIVMGCAEMLRGHFFMNSSHLDMFMNCVDGLALGEEMVDIRGRKPIDRSIASPSPETRLRWKIVNYTLAASIIAAIGIVTTSMRIRSRNAYTMAFGVKED